MINVEIERKSSIVKSVMKNRMLASVTLRKRGVELRYEDYSPIKLSLSLFGLTMHP